MHMLDTLYTQKAFTMDAFRHLLYVEHINTTVEYPNEHKFT